MTNQIDQFIHDLYIETKTPDIMHNYLITPEVNDLVEFVCQCKALRTDHLDVTDGDIANTIHLALRIVDLPSDLTGAEMIEPCIHYLIRAASDALGGDASVYGQCSAILTAFHEILRLSPPNSRFKYNRKPCIEIAPLYRFHLDSYQESILKDKRSCPLYHAYAYRLHKAIRDNQLQDPAYTTHLAYARSARIFFKYTQAKTKALPEHPANMPMRYIIDSIREYNKSETGTYEPLTSNAKNYMRLFIALIKRTKINPKPHPGYNHSVDEPAPDGDITITEQDDQDFKFVDVSCAKPESKDEAEDYEYQQDLDLDHLLLDPSKSTVPEKPYLTTFHRDIANIRSFHYFWEGRYLNLFQLGICYLAMNAHWNSSEKNNAIIVFLYIIIHTGIEDTRLINLMRLEGCPDDERLELKESAGRLYILIPGIVKLKRPASPECLPTSNKVEIPLPYAACEMLKTLPSDEYAFSYVDNRGRLRRLNLIDVKEFIKTRINFNENYAAYNLKISLPHFTSSFLPLYNSRFGLDPLICCHIQGADYHRLYSAPMHYVHIPKPMLEQEYSKTYRLAHQSIRANLQECIDRGLFSSDCILDSPIFETTDFLNSCDQNGETIGYGSTVIPRSGYVQCLISSLHTACSNESNPLTKHNLFNIYAFWALQFATAHRPDNIPDITWKRISNDMGLIMISDKQSAQYHEERVLPLPKTLQLLLGRLRSGFATLQSYVAKNIAPSSLYYSRDVVFFFVESDGTISDFTIPTMKEILNTASIKYDLPANLPRHFLRNFFYHHGISNDLANAWMGHQHAGRELLNISSASMPGSVATQGLEITSAMLDDIGFSDIEYLR